MGARDLVVIGGCGRAGLPLALGFAQAGLDVGIYDINADAVTLVNQAIMPFEELGATEVLHRLASGKLIASCDPSIISGAEYVIVIVGTPVDEHLNPDPLSVVRAVENIAEHLRDEQLIILRSTLYPGTTRLVEQALERQGRYSAVAFCPERIAEGRALLELHELPQIVAARTEDVYQRTASLFQRLNPSVVRLTPEEAELAKLFTNIWRYIKFATANQLFMLATDFGLDYERVRLGLTQDYPRAADMPGAGFAAGPCLLKDTMQLALFNNSFLLGHAAMMVNEGLPMYLVSKLGERYELETMTVGILGMAFKEESDDIRSSLSFKLRRILRFKARDVLCHDPYVPDERFVSLDDILKHSDLLILATPHQIYLDLKSDVPLIDLWGRAEHGTRL